MKEQVTEMGQCIGCRAASSFLTALRLLTTTASVAPCICPGGTCSHMEVTSIELDPVPQGLCTHRNSDGPKSHSAEGLFLASKRETSLSRGSVHPTLAVPT